MAGGGVESVLKSTKETGGGVGEARCVEYDDWYCTVLPLRRGRSGLPETELANLTPFACT